MIAKLITGNGFGGAVKYSTKYGKDPDGSLHKLLSVCGVTFDFDDSGELTINPRKVGWDFRQQTLGYSPDTKNYRPIKKPVYHWILSWKEGERKIPPKEMIDVAQEFLKRIGFTNTQYVISVHYDQDNQHLHIVANIVNNEGKRIVTQGLIDKAHEVAAAITKERGYAWGEPARKETVESAHKPHEKVRYIIEPIIFEAVRTSLTEDELVSKLKASRINTRIRHAENGKRGGISFACWYRGVEHTFRGSSVDRRLSYGNIMIQLQENRTRVEQSMPKEKILGLYPAVKDVGSFVEEAYRKYKGLGVDHLRRKDINDTITTLYGNLRKHYSDLRMLKLEERLDSENMKDLRAIGIILMGTFPVLGFALALMSYIMGWVYEKESIEEKRLLLEKINLSKKTIDEFKAIREELNRSREMKTLLKYNGFDMSSLDVFNKPTDEIIEKVDKILFPYKEEIRLADEKEALAKMPLPDVILVTRENYDSVRLPEGFGPYRSGNNIVVRQQVVPEEGLVVFKDKGKYGILPRRMYEQYQADLKKIRERQERYRKWAGNEVKPSPKKGRTI